LSQQDFNAVNFADVFIKRKVSKTTAVTCR